MRGRDEWEGGMNEREGGMGRRDEWEGEMNEREG